jgi:hypothetical protein
VGTDEARDLGDKGREARSVGTADQVPAVPATGGAAQGSSRSSGTLDGVRCCWSRAARRDTMTRSIQHLNWAALGANLGSALLFTLLLLSPFLWGAPLWHWLLAVAIALVLGLYFYVRREHYEEPGPDADETRFPR